VISPAHDLQTLPRLLPRRTGKPNTNPPRSVGRAILVRYEWNDISPKSARMQQSFSADGGKTWEVNWIVELSR